MALHFKCSPLELDDEQILNYPHSLKTQIKTPSSSYFKHALYGLRFSYKTEGLEPRLIALPSLKHPWTLPVVLNFNEVIILLKTPQLLKYRRMLHIREGKGKKDGYDPLGENLVIGLKKYFGLVLPKNSGRFSH